MENQFIPYELALKLKRLGFNDGCCGIYYHEDFRFIQLSGPIIGNNYETYVTAPLWQQAFDWFRDKYNIVYTIYSNASGYVWELHYNIERGGTHICDSGENGDCEMSGMFTTYEKAREACLEKLIEIVEQKTK